MNSPFHCSSLGNGSVIAVNAAVDNGAHKPSPSLLALASLVIAATAAKIRAAVEAQAPEGYEDASGFHFGRPAPTRRRPQENPSLVPGLFGLRCASRPACPPRQTPARPQFNPAASANRSG